MKTFEIREKMVEKLRGVPTKLLIYHLLPIPEYQSWYYINA